MEQNVVTIGRSVVIKGELSAKEDLTIEGEVDGHIALDGHVLTIGSTGRIKAQVQAKVVTVIGTVDGDITATEAINMGETATVDGALATPRIDIKEGASFRGQIDMQRAQPPTVPAPSRRTTSAHSSP